MSVKKVILLIVLVLVASLTIFVVITFRQIDEIMSEGVSEPVDRDDYVMMSFELRESSGNAMSTEPGQSQSFRFSYETIYIDTAQTNGYNKIDLDETSRKNLETDLLALIEKHNLQEWDGYDEYLEVMDASHSFSFRVEYENEDKIIASGSFMFPDNYDAVFVDVKEVFLKYV